MKVRVVVVPPYNTKPLKYIGRIACQKGAPVKHKVVLLMPMGRFVLPKRGKAWEAIKLFV